MERIDTLKNGNKIIQDPEKFCFGIDAVLLAHFASNEIKRGDSVVDLCTGNGIIPMLLEKSSMATHLTGVEIQKESADFARKSIQLNNLENKITLINGDIKNVNEWLPKHQTQIVTCNPPYMINEHGRQNNTDFKTIARHEIFCNFEDVVKAADYLLSTDGKFFLIHRPFRLAEIFSTLKQYKLEPKRMQLIQPFENTEPNIVLLEARKNAHSRLKIEKNLIVYEKPGLYTQEIQEIYNN